MKDIVSVMVFMPCLTMDASKDIMRVFEILGRKRRKEFNNWLWRNQKDVVPEGHYLSMVSWEEDKA